MYTVNTQRLSLLPCLFVLSIKLTVYTSCVAADNGTGSAPSRAKRSMRSAHAHSALSVNCACTNEIDTDYKATCAM